MSDLISVLRGAIVPKTGSSAAALAGAMLTVTDAGRRIARWNPQHDSPLPPLTPFARIGKTGWQIGLPDPALSLRAFLLVQARLLSTTDRLTSRMVIAIGPADHLDINGQSPMAERAMAELGKLTFARFVGPEPAYLPQAILDLADQIARNWTQEQAEAMALALPPDTPTLAAMSAQLAISKQAVSYRLTGAGLRAIRAALAGWERSAPGFASASQICTTFRTLHDTDRLDL
ncbi:MAG: hypothetical protein WCS20_04595 [Alphaproteobacteria bacterium]